MKFAEALAIFAIIAAVSATAVNIHPLSDENIALINQKAKTWKAGRNFDVKDWATVKKLSNGVLSGKRLTNTIVNPHDESEDVPETFDAREAWPKCDSIKQIADQSACGSCWALGAVEAMSDRICIHSNQTEQVYVSADDLLGCCGRVCGNGCDGGYLEESWQYWQQVGIVTGGLYESSQGCKDYSLMPCEHHGKGDRPKCSDIVFTTPSCATHCYDSSLNYNESFTYGQQVYTFTNAKQIQLEIYKNGPIESGFVVFDDFPSYKSGVYQATSQTVVGSHGIKILGWGVEDGVDYWLIANSWNTDWGDEGYFKFLRGVNHCGLEANGVASLPKL